MSAGRDYWQARAAYVGAIRLLDTALTRFDRSDIPMDPGPGLEPLPWTQDHVEIITDVGAAFMLVIRRRREWDAVRHAIPPH